jgi:hypothetical protein
MNKSEIPTGLPPRDIPADLIAYALIGGPWLARFIFAWRLVLFASRLIIPWRYGGYLEIRRSLLRDMEA